MKANQNKNMTNNQKIKITQIIKKLKSCLVKTKKKKKKKKATSRKSPQKKRKKKKPTSSPGNE